MYGYGTAGVVYSENGEIRYGEGMAEVFYCSKIKNRVQPGFSSI